MIVWDFVIIFFIFCILVLSVFGFFMGVVLVSLSFGLEFLFLGGFLFCAVIGLIDVKLFELVLKSDLIKVLIFLFFVLNGLGFIGGVRRCFYAFVGSEIFDDVVETIFFLTGEFVCVFKLMFILIIDESEVRDLFNFCFFCFFLYFLFFLIFFL